jgi:hypothetical protein
MYIYINIEKIILNSMIICYVYIYKHRKNHTE